MLSVFCKNLTDPNDELANSGRNDQPKIYKCIVCPFETKDYGEIGHCVECENSICYRHIVDDRLEFFYRDCCETYYYRKLLSKLAKYQNALGSVGICLLYIYVQEKLERCDIYETACNRC